MATLAMGAARRATGTGEAVPAPSNPFQRALSSATLAALLVVGLSVPIIALKTEQDINNQLVLVQRWGLVVIFAAVAFMAAVGISLQRGVLGRLFILLGSFLAGIAGLRVSELPAQHTMVIAGGAIVIYCVGLALDPRRIDRPLGALIGRHVPSEGVMRWIGLVFMFAYPIIALVAAGNAGAIKWVDNFGVQILIYIMLGWGLNIVVGLAGLLDLGYVAFYAVGAYAYAIIATKVIPATFPSLGVWAFWVCLPVAGVLAALWGVILGFPVLRLRGDYLAIVTLAFGEIIRLILINWVDFSNGYAGIETPRITFFGIPFSSPTGARTFSDIFGLTQSATFYRSFFLYYVILVLALVTALITDRLRRLPVGRAWEALREDEIACRSLGINTTNTKLTAFAIGAMFGGFAGAFFGARQGFVDPKSFEFMESATILAIVVLGGMGSLVGVALAAVVMIGGIEILRELDWLKQIFGRDFNPADYRMLLFGLGMVLMMIWKPRGFISTREPSLFLKERRAISGSLVKEGHG